MKTKDWSGKTGGKAIGQRALLLLFRFHSVMVGYTILAPIIPFYMLFAHKRYIAIYRYFRLRHGYSIFKSFFKTYHNHYIFGQCMMDKFAMIAGRRNFFEVEIEGNDLFNKLLDGDKGLIIASSHVGNFELSGYLLQQDKKRINAMVYAQENTTVYGNKRVKTLYSNKINVMSVTSDFSHVFIMNDLLQKGEIISMPCDRNFGSSKVARCNFFNSKAEFPQGAFALAATLNVPIIAMCVMKKSAFKYHIYIKDLSINNDDNMKKSEKIACLAQKFATNLETIVKKYPEQWFNFYDFWNVEDTIVK